jgi:hypothetical protein
MTTVFAFGGETQSKLKSAERMNDEMAKKYLVLGDIRS